MRRTMYLAFALGAILLAWHLVAWMYPKPAVVGAVDQNAFLEKELFRYRLAHTSLHESETDAIDLGEIEIPVGKKLLKMDGFFREEKRFGFLTLNSEREEPGIGKVIMLKGFGAINEAGPFEIQCGLPDKEGEYPFTIVFEEYDRDQNMKPLFPWKFAGKGTIVMTPADDEKK